MKTNSLCAPGKLDFVFGGQAGSEAKGKIAGYLAIKYGYHAAVASFMPNAGHTWISNDGNKVMVQSLPQAVVDPDTRLFISAGAALDLKLFFGEIEKYNVDPKRISIHPRTIIVQDIHKEREAGHAFRISSTLKGCGEALADKARRSSTCVLAKDVDELKDFVYFDFNGDLYDALSHGHSVLMEVAQGFDLDVNHGVSFPYCTSRQCTPMQALADVGLPHTMVGEVIAVIRPYPIRVGNAFDGEGKQIGTSGDYPADEISWEEIARRSGTPFEEISEYTTVTGKLRRCFEPNFDRMAQMVAMTGTTQIALNFANYIDYSVKGATTKEQLTAPVWQFIHRVEEATGAKVTLVGTGPKDGEIVDLSG